MENFSELNLHPTINRALSALSSKGYVKPTPVQAQSIPTILKGNDVVVSAQTGTGKTAAFVLPALHLLTQIKTQALTTLILTPTRELAGQVTKAVETYGRYLGVNTASLVGGERYDQQIRKLREAQIIIATPGRLIDHMKKGRVNLSTIKMLVLDEADRMLDMGFAEDVQYIVKHAPQESQTLLFTATVDKEMMKTVRQVLKDPVRIDLSSQVIAAPQIEQICYRVNGTQHKMHLLRHLLKETNIYKAIIFSATKINADKIADELCAEGFAAAALHGDLKQHTRNRTVDKLRKGVIQFLVATDVAARGIDIKDITHVINLDLPKFAEDYVHRIGRTGRAGKSGTAISFVCSSDMRHLNRIEQYIGQRLSLTKPADLGPMPLASSYEMRPPHAERPRSFEHKKRAFGEKRGSGERRSFGERHASGEKHSFGERHASGEKRSFGERHGSGERRSFGERHGSGEKRSFGERSFDGKKQASGERSSKWGAAKPFNKHRRPSNRARHSEERSDEATQR